MTLCGGRSKQQAPPSDCVSGYVVKSGKEYNRAQEGRHLVADDRSNRRHLATVLVDMWSKADKSTIVVKRAWLDLERKYLAHQIFIILTLDR